MDVLAIGAHPDDVELGVGGLLHKLTARGLDVAILDLTRGELSSRGTVEARNAEAAKAARLLKIEERENAGLPDGVLENTPDHRAPVIRSIRRHRPRLILAPMTPDRHPDHQKAYDLVRDANFFAGLVRIETGQPPHRAPQVLYYHPYHDSEQAPDMVIDISEHFEAKCAALRAYASQFFNPEYEGADTYIASEAFWNGIETRAAYWGGQAGFRYGEPLHAEGPLGLEWPPRLV